MEITPEQQADLDYGLESDLSSVLFWLEQVEAVVHFVEPPPLDRHKIFEKV